MTKIRRALSLIGGVVFGCSVAAHADTFTTFNINGTLTAASSLPNFGSFAGTVTLDSTTGLFTDSNFTVSVTNGSQYLFTGAPLDHGVNLGTYSYTDFYNQAGDNFGFSLPQASQIGYMGGSICANIGSLSTCPEVTSGFVIHGTSGFNTVTAGTLSIPAVVSTTPEPSSLVLLGTGLIAVVGARRRR